MDDAIKQQIELLKLDARIAVLENWTRADHAWICDIVDPNTQSVRVRQLVLVDANDRPCAVLEAGPNGLQVRTLAPGADPKASVPSRNRADAGR
jgi:hypothetical protein